MCFLLMLCQIPYTPLLKIAKNPSAVLEYTSPRTYSRRLCATVWCPPSYSIMRLDARAGHYKRATLFYPHTSVVFSRACGAGQTRAEPGILWRFVAREWGGHRRDAEDAERARGDGV